MAVGFSVRCSKQQLAVGVDGQRWVSAGPVDHYRPVPLTQHSQCPNEPYKYPPPMCRSDPCIQHVDDLGQSDRGDVSSMKPPRPLEQGPQFIYDPLQPFVA